MESDKVIRSLWLNLSEWAIRQGTNETQYKFQPGYARVYHFSTPVSNQIKKCNCQYSQGATNLRLSEKQTKGGNSSCRHIQYK